MENAWQFCKVYPEFLNRDGSLDERKYFAWAQHGWNTSRPLKYPFEIPRKPLFYFWDGKRYDEIEARKKIYIPLYVKSAGYTDAFYRLKWWYETLGCVTLRDPDSYDNEIYGLSLNDVINCRERKMSHSFVVAMMLEGYITDDYKVRKPRLTDE